jgi:pilus assembly protein CpaB
MGTIASGNRPNELVVDDRHIVTRFLPRRSSMSLRTIIVSALALMCGISAAVGVNAFRSPSEAAPERETVDVVVTAIDIPRGTTITEDYVFVRQWPKDQLPEGAIASIEKAVDRTVVIPLLKGEPVVEKKIASKEAGRGMAPLVTKGMRAFTIHTPTAAAGVAGFVLPGNKVDVLVTLPGGRDDETGGGVTVTLLQNVEVLAVDQQTEAPESNKVEKLRSVTLLVTERQAQKLSLAQNRGTLNLALRNESDMAAAESSPVTLRDIRYAQGKPLVPSAEETKASNEPVAVKQVPKQPVRFRIRTIRGTTSGQVILQQYPAVIVDREPQLSDSRLK